MTRVVVVTDIRLYRDGLVSHLQAQPSLEVVGSASSAVEGIACVEASQPDIALIDLMLAECHAAIREIRHAAPQSRVVLLGFPEEEGSLVACAEAGVAGFVPRESSLADLVATLERAARDEVLVPPKAAAMLLRRVAVLAANVPPSTGTVVALTARETEIARLLDDGRSNKEIARCLGIEVATVKNHLHHILDKWKLRRRGEIPRMMRAQAFQRSTRHPA